jgi:hypothetical protein
MITLRDTMAKLLEEVDPDIKELMLSDSDTATHPGGLKYRVWELVESPMLVVLEWQAMRDRKKHGNIKPN